MQYGLGVDLGTSSTVAAVRRPGSDEARLVQLSASSYSIPSVVAIGADGTLLAGEAAERRGVTHPTSAVREFKRRFGDPAPVVVDGQVFTPDALMAAQLADVLDRVERSEGTRPATLVLTHPAAWGPFRLDAMRAMAAASGVGESLLVPEPVAAAVANRDRLADGALVAVYDLGGGTFDAAVVRCSGAEDTWAVVGTPEGVERLGGADIDQAVLGHVDAVLGGQVFTADANAPETRAALLRLRTACREAKEQLSEDTDVEIPVDLPGVQTRVRLTRNELEGMIRPRLADSLAVLDRVVASAGASWEEIDAVLLVGGSSRIPAVGQMVQEHAGRPVLTATNPQLAVALGAATFALGGSGAPGSPGAPDAAGAAALGGAPADGRPGVPPPPPVSGAGAVPATPATPATPAAPVTPAAPAAPVTPRRRGLLIGAALAVVAAVVVGVLVLGVLVLGGGGGDDAAGSAASTAPGPETTEPVSTQPAGDAGSTTQPAEPAEPAEPDEPTDPGDPADPGDEAVLAALQAAGLAGDACVGAAPVGSVTGIAVDGDLIVMAVDGGVQTFADDGSCAFTGGSTVVPTGSGRQHVAAVAGTVLSSGDGGGEVRLPNGATVACAQLTGPVALNDDRVALTWDDGGRTARFEFTTESCTLAEADVYPDTQVTAAAFASTNAVVLGADGAGGSVVTRYNRRRVDWTSPLAGTGIDAVAACGTAVCALDREAQTLHLVGTDGAEIGAVTVSALLGLTGMEAGDGVTAAAVAIGAAPGGPLVVLVSDPSGTTQIVRVAT